MLELSLNLTPWLFIILASANHIPSLLPRAKTSYNLILPQLVLLGFTDYFQTILRQKPGIFSRQLFFPLQCHRPLMLQHESCLLLPFLFPIKTGLEKNVSLPSNTCCIFLRRNNIFYLELPTFIRTTRLCLSIVFYFC